MYRYLVRITANPAVAEDLFQETWLKVITRIHRYDERRPFEPCLWPRAETVLLAMVTPLAPLGAAGPDLGYAAVALILSMGLARLPRAFARL